MFFKTRIIKQSKDRIVSKNKQVFYLFAARKKTTSKKSISTGRSVVKRLNQFF